MTVTVGTDTYLSVADADTYWANRNDTTWAAASTAAKEAALREATLYIDGTYSFIGYQILENALCWPRMAVTICEGNLAGKSYDNLTIPPQIKNATAELAREALDGFLMASQDRGGMVVREKVDTIEVEYAKSAPAGRSFPFVGAMLKPLISGGGAGMKKLVRS